MKNISSFVIIIISIAKPLIQNSKNIFFHIFCTNDEVFNKIILLKIKTINFIKLIQKL